MAAHLAGEERAVLLHFRLDERVADLPHDGAAAPPLDVVVEGLRAFPLAHNGGTRKILENVAGEDEQELVTPENVPVFVDGAEPIRVAVEGDAQIGAFDADFLLQISQILRDSGIGMMVREGAVEVAEQLDHFVPEGSEEPRPDDPAGAIAGIDDDSELAGGLAKRLRDEVEVGGRNVVLELATLSRARPGLRVDVSLECLHLRTRHGALSDPNLEAVVFGWIVRAGDHAEAIDRERVRGEVGERSRHDSDGEDVDPLLARPSRETALKLRA